MAAPSPNPFLVSARRLDEQFRFGLNTLIYDSLNKLVSAIEDRLQPLDAKVIEIDDIVDDITAVALQRMDEVFTPLIEEATSRLEQFGVAFSATSDTTLTIGAGAKSVILPVGQREAFAFGDFVTIRHTGGTESMSAAVGSYQRDIGQLNVNVTSFVGSGTFNAWDIFFSAAPNLAHEARTDNPHLTTAAQVGAYTQAQVDTLLSDHSIAMSAQINNLQAQINALSTGTDVSALNARISTLESLVPTEIKTVRWVG